MAVVVDQIIENESNGGGSVWRELCHHQSSSRLLVFVLSFGIHALWQPSRRFFDCLKIWSQRNRYIVDSVGSINEDTLDA